MQALTKIDELKKTNSNTKTTSALNYLATEYNEFLTIAFRTTSINPTLIQETIKKREINPSYLPNYFPPFLSEPAIEENEVPIKEKRKYFLLKRTQELTNATPIPEKINQEENGKTLPEAQQYSDLLWVREHFLENEFLPKQFPLEKHDEQYKRLWRTEYFDEYQREKYRVHIANGRFCQLVSSKGWWDTSLNLEYCNTHKDKSHGANSRAMFVISKLGEIFVGSDANSKLQLRHTSFTAGDEVFFAGEIEIDKEGYITAISDRSGHYHPSVDNINNCIAYLYKIGVDLSRCKVLLEYNEDKTAKPHEPLDQICIEKISRIVNNTKYWEIITGNKSPKDLNFINNHLLNVNLENPSENLRQLADNLETNEKFTNSSSMFFSKSTHSSVSAELKQFLKLLQSLNMLTAAERTVALFSFVKQQEDTIKQHTLREKLERWEVTRINLH